MGKVINLINIFKVDKFILNNAEYNELELELIQVLEEKKFFIF